MAAGVGKTYRMLQEGRQAQAEGRDVVIGYLEPHDRPETAALAEGLEVVPRLRVSHGALELEEMDVDAVVRRAPELALVDELAHTNAPGSRNAKRYQDIDEILAAGIDVVSTVNIQHLESLNDAVFELTGVRVRETFPDRVLDDADEVVLVDLSPEALQDRLRSRQGLPRRPGRAGARSTSSVRRTSPRCASSRCARSPRTSRPAARAADARSAQPAGGRRARARARRRRSRARSASSAAPGARRSGSAPRSTRCGCAGPGRSSPRGARRSSPRSGGSPRSSACTSSRRRATTSSTTVRRVVARARLDLRLRRHAGRAAAGSRSCAARSCRA